MNRQDFYRKEYQRLRPNWIDSMSIYRDYIDKNTCDGTRILDFGCGHVDFMRSVYSRTRYVYGIEPNKDTLRRNITIKHRVAGFAEHIPFPNSFFDLSVSAWVVEHIDNPRAVFCEIHRVLKPGGRLVFLTPNAWNYITWINRSIPNNMHDFLTRRLYNREKEDTYPVRYKMNSRRSIDAILLPLKFRKQQIIFNGDPSYISFNRALFALSCLIEEFFEFIGLEAAKVHIIGIYQKI